VPAIGVVWGFELFFSSSSQEKEDENDGDDDNYKNFTLAEQYSEHFGFCLRIYAALCSERNNRVRVAVKGDFVKKGFYNFRFAIFDFRFRIVGLRFFTSAFAEASADRPLRIKERWKKNDD